MKANIFISILYLFIGVLTALADPLITVDDVTRAILLETNEPPEYSKTNLHSVKLRRDSISIDYLGSFNRDKSTCLGVASLRISIKDQSVFEAGKGESGEFFFYIPSSKEVEISCHSSKHSIFPGNIIITMEGGDSFSICWIPQKGYAIVENYIQIDSKQNQNVSTDIDELFRN